MSQPEVKSDFYDDSDFDFYDGYDARQQGVQGCDGDGHLVLHNKSGSLSSWLLAETASSACFHNSQSLVINTYQLSSYRCDVQVAMRRELSQQMALKLLLKIAASVGDHGLKSVQEALDQMKVNQVLNALDGAA